MQNFPLLASFATGTFINSASWHSYTQQKLHCYYYYSFILGFRIKWSRALGASLLSLPVVVARAYLLVSSSPRRNTETLCTALLTEEHAWLLVRSGRTPIWTPSTAFCIIFQSHYNFIVHYFSITLNFFTHNTISIIIYV